MIPVALLPPGLRLHLRQQLMDPGGRSDGEINKLFRSIVRREVPVDWTSPRTP